LEQRIKDLEEELKDCKQTVTMAFESENLLQRLSTVLLSWPGRWIKRAY
jgi:hypothetical protein